MPDLRLPPPSVSQDPHRPLPEDLLRDASRRLEQLVLACLAKNPNDRPSDAGQLARALSAVDVAAWTEEDARRWWEENRTSAPRNALDVPNNTRTKATLDESAEAHAF